MTGLSRHTAAPGIAAAGAVGITSLVLAVAGASVFDVFASTVLLAMLAALAWTDAVTETVPDGLTLGLVVAGLLYQVISGASPFPFVGGVALLIAAGFASAALTQDRGAIGSGDYLLIAGIVAWFGPIHTLDVLALSAFGLFAHGLIARQRTVALAPSLAASASFIWIGGPIL